MKNVLMLSVGGSPQPLRSAIEGARWDRLHFVVSHSAGDGPTSRALVDDAEIEYVRAAATRPPVRGPGLRHLASAPASVGVTEIPPDDLDSALARVDAALAAELAGGNHVTVDYTGGTKTMTAAMVLAATAHEGVTLQFMSGHRPDLRQVKAGSEAPVEMPGELIGLARLFAAARSFVSRRNYGAAKAVMIEASSTMRGTNPPKSWRRRIEEWLGLLTVLDAWDRFEHKEALSKWENAYDRGAGWAAQFENQGLAARLKPLCTTSGKPTAELLEDLWLNAQRRAGLVLHDDALARLYRLAEATVQCRLWMGHEIDTSAVDPVRLTDAELQRAEMRSGWRGKDFCVLPLTQALGVLNRLDPNDPVIAIWPTDGKGRFKTPDWQQGRNHSILAHGFQPTKLQDYKSAESWFRQRLLPVWQDMLKRPLDEQLPNSLP